jgi:hypothetical protein
MQPIPLGGRGDFVPELLKLPDVFPHRHPGNAQGLAEAFTGNNVNTLKVRDNFCFHAIPRTIAFSKRLIALLL